MILLLVHFFVLACGFSVITKYALVRITSLHYAME